MSALVAEIATARSRLRPFSDGAICPACGCAEVATLFHAAHSRHWGDAMERLLNVATSYTPFDLLQRTCRRCARTWAELPLDTVTG